MRRTITPLLTIATLIALAAAPTALAKEWLEARLDAPIAMGTPGGTEIVVGITVVAPDDETGEMHPVEGSPVYLKLTGRDGDTTRAAAAGDRTPGHYTVRIAIPAGGARGIEIGIHGNTDLPMMVMNDPFTFGDITAATAQLAPPLATPAPVKPAAPAVAPEPEPVPAATPVPGVPAAVLGLLATFGLVALAAVAVWRRRRASDVAPRSA